MTEDKEKIEKQIRNKVNEIFDDDYLKKKLREKLQENDDNKINKQFNNNYSNDEEGKNWFLLKAFDKNNNVLVLGCNPGGGDWIKNNLYEFLGFDKENFDQNSEESKVLDILEGINIYENYHYLNYKLFKGIEGKFFWAYETLENIINLSNKIIGKIENDEYNKLEENKKNEKKNKIQKLGKEKISETIKEIYEKENQKKGPYIIFADLFCYANGKQSDLKDYIEENYKIDNDKQNGKQTKNNELKERYKLRRNIKEILKCYIEYYNSKMIVVTNAYASDLIYEALFAKGNKRFDIKKQEKIYDAINVKCGNQTVPIIFSGMVSGGHSLDKYSYLRLKRRIEEVFSCKCNEIIEVKLSEK